MDKEVTMSNNKQSSVVDWIFSQLPYEYKTTRSGFDVYQQAKSFERECIETTYDDAIQDVRQDEERPLKGSEYYNIHFKKNG